MRILSPILASLACAGALAGAEDGIKPEFDFGGFIHVYGSVGDETTQDEDATATDEDRYHAEFHGWASATADVRLTERLGGRLDLWLIPSGHYTDPILRDMYAAWHQDDWTVSAGKNIRPLGWVRPHPQTWYRVRASTIGYLAGEPLEFEPSIFGNDVLGGAVTWKRADVPIQATAFLNNGFFSESDDGNYDAFGRERQGLGYGAEIAYIQPDERVRVDFEVAFDPRSVSFEPYAFGMRDAEGVPAEGGDRAVFSRNGGAGAESGGDVLLLVLNTTLTLVDRLTIGAEIARFQIGESVEADEEEIDDTDYERWQGLLMANYALPGTPFPMSVTAMIQHIEAEQGDQEGEANELTAALLTRPLADLPQLHLDGEITYADVESDQTGGSNGWELAIRALLAF